MPNRIGEIDGSIIRQSESESVFCFRAGAKINADGDPRAYHPCDIGRDCLANAGRPGNWWAIATDNGKTNGNPVVQGKDEPAPGYYVCTTSLGDPGYKNTDQRRYVDSSKIPFFVLPRGNYFGAKLGDFGVVLNHRTGKYCGGIFADSGPPDKIGEVSIALAEELAVDADPKDGGSSSSDYLYVVFPGSGVGWPLSAAEVKARAGKQFTDWGGFGKLAEFYPDLISTVIKPRERKTMASIQLKDVFQYYKGLPHQIEAIRLLQNTIPDANLEAFAEIWRSVPESAPAAEAKPTTVTVNQIGDASYVSVEQLKKAIGTTSATGNAFVDGQTAKLAKYCEQGKAPNLNTGTNYYSQRDNYTMPHRTCNSSSNAMYLDWLRRSTGRPGLGGDGDYLRTLLTFGDTIYHENQTEALKKYGFSTAWLDDSNTERVNALLDAGFPVVVNILHRGSIDSPRGGHVIMLCGRRKSEGTYISMDPYGTLGSDYSDPNGKYAPISKRSFDARWQGGYRVLA
jgi:hypothetical protein